MVSVIKPKGKAGKFILASNFPLLLSRCNFAMISFTLEEASIAPPSFLSTLPPSKFLSVFRLKLRENS